MNKKLEPIEAQIKSSAHAIGFSLIGITLPNQPRTYSTYQQWLDDGKHAGMGYLASDRGRERRKDPKKILPECASIVVTATAYLPEDHFASSERAEARVASYALGDDYHDVIVDRLDQLAGSIEDIVDQTITSRVYTDTGPILERDLAQRAGLGWIGKNTCLINPDHGSYFLLGEILLDYPLEPDPPFEADRCGACTRCLEACPTECILPDRTIDAGRCISYLTIEEKGAIEEDLRSELGNWIFGCDICQQVCPWNERFARPTTDPAFQPREFLRNPDLDSFLNLRPGSWLQDLRSSPLERPRRRGLVRNAAAVAGNLRSTEHVDPLADLLHSDPEPVVRRHAAWALGQVNNSRARSELQNALGREAEDDVLQEILAALQPPE